MATFIKCVLGLFILGGLAISFYGCREILGTLSFVKNAPERTKGIFTGYDREIVESRASSPSPTQWGQADFQDTISVMSYPQFEFVDKDGNTRQIRESKHHVIERFKRGQEVEIIVSPYGDHRMAGFYSLYARDICILAVGLCFMFIPMAIWSVAVPSLKTPAGMELQSRVGILYDEIASTKVGPVPVSAIVKGSAAFFALILLIALGASSVPFLKQMRLGFDWGLIEALEQKRFEEARALIVKKKGINKVTEYDQTPLLLALEAGQADLARLLIEAGADVNIKSKMNKTPLQTAALAGDLKTVRLLLAKGASPDAPEDETPPVFQAIMKGHDEIARVMIESGCDLKRKYISGERRFTVGDLAIIAKKPELVDLVRSRGGSFTIPH